MGFMDKFKNMVNPEEGYEEDYNNEYYESDDYAPMEQNATRENQSYGSVGGSYNSALELKVVRPDRFENVTQIADYLIGGSTVVLNLEATNKDTARRMIDFLSGVAYSIEGNLKTVANNTFVITPGNVSVSADQQTQAYPGGNSEPIL